MPTSVLFALLVLVVLIAPHVIEWAVEADKSDEGDVSAKSVSPDVPPTFEMSANDWFALSARFAR